MMPTTPPCSDDGVLLFDPDTHTYTLDGVKLDSVTSVIEGVLREKNPFWSMEHSIRGTFVHRITEAIDEGWWSPEDTVVPDPFPREEIINRGYAYQKWLDGTGFVSIANELRLSSQVLGIAGTEDKLGRFTRGDLKGKTAVVDIKSGEPGKGAKLQVAFYNILQSLHPSGIGKLADVQVVLHLRADGTPRPHYRMGADAEQDRRAAYAVLETYRYLQREGMI